MRTTSVIGTALLVATGAWGNEPWSESFETIRPGPLVGQAGWEPWLGQPNAGEFMVVDGIARDDERSLAIDGSDHAVRTFDACDQGIWAMTWWMRVPPDLPGNQRIVLLNTYPPDGPAAASVILEIIGPESVLLDPISGVAVPLQPGAWTKVAVVIDLLADQRQVFVDGEPFAEGGWSDGVEPGGAPRIAAIALDGLGSPVPVHFDTMFLEALAPMPPCPGDVVPDGHIGFDDLLAVLAAWGPCDGDCPADVDGSGAVEFADLLAVLAGFGPCPVATCLDPESIALGPDGSWTAPDWASPVVMTPYAVDSGAFGGQPIIDAQPGPGEVFFGPQIVEATFTVSGGGEPVVVCSTPIELVDRTPPTVTVTGLEKGDLIVLPDVAAPEIMVVDEIDPSPEIIATLDGEPVSLPLVVDQPGTHVLRVLGVDASGNESTNEPIIFEVTAFPRVDAEVVVEELSLIESDTGFWSMDATVLLAAEAFPETELDLYTVDLWALNASGMPINRAPIPIAGSEGEDGGYNFMTTEALYQNGFWRLRFVVDAIDENLITAPSAFEITATGRHTQPGEFDLRSRPTPAIIVPNPLQHLESLNLINDDPPAPPPPAPQWAPCKWKHSIDIGEVDRDFGGPTCTCWGGLQLRNKALYAIGGKFQGFCTAIDECTGNATESAAVSSYATMRVWLEGPADCCGCEIECIFRPKFKAKVSLNGPGSALGAGLIDIASTCSCSTRAVGALGAGSGAPTTVTFGAGATVGPDGPQVGANISATVTIADNDEDTELFTGNCVGTVQKCSIVISIVSNAKVKAKADAGVLDWYARAEATLLEATPGITVTARCLATEGPCAGVMETFTYK